LLSGVINFFQTGEIKNPKHNPTHTAQTLVLDGQLYVIDSDYDGIEPESWEEWKKGKSMDSCV